MSNAELDFFALTAGLEQSVPAGDQVAIPLASPAAVFEQFGTAPLDSHFRNMYPSRDIDYMARQIGPGWRDFKDMTLLVEPFRKRLGGGTVRAYFGSTRPLSGDLSSDAAYSVLGMYIDHPEFLADGSSTFFHLEIAKVTELGTGPSWNAKFMTGLLAIIELGSEIDPTDQDEYKDYRQLIGANCTVAGC